MHFRIDLSLVPKSEPRYLHQIVDNGPTTLELVDCMGQILQQMGHNLLPKKSPVRNLNELGKAAGIFTRCVRGKIVQADIATRVMLLHPLSPENMGAVAALLVPHHTIEFYDKTGKVVFSSAPETKSFTEFEQFQIWQGMQ